MDTVLRNARLSDNSDGLVDIGLKDGRIAAIEPELSATGLEVDVAGKLVSPSFVETHIHLDKSCLLDRCTSKVGDLDEAIREVARAKKNFTAKDVYERGKRTLEKCISQGTTHMRTHLEVDPGIGIRSLEGVLALIADYRWAIDIEVCVFPQEGLINNPGTDELMVEALKKGATVVGAAPYTDSEPRKQIDRVFELAREFDADIDMHLDFGETDETLDLFYVCELCDRYRWGGRTTIGHVTKLSTSSRAQFEKAAKSLADAGVALTSLPSTDLFLMGRNMEHSVMRGVTKTHELLPHGVNCSLSTNNVLNPFTPFGDCSLLRIANLNANVCHVGSVSGIRECFNMISTRSASLMNLDNYGLKVGADADLIVLDSETPEAAVAELAPVLYVFKRGLRTVTRAPAQLHRP